MSIARSCRPAFTLIEVILAIGLSAALLALLTGAIGLYVVRLESSRHSVQESQLARSVLRLVADDLRSAATVYVQDTATTSQLAASQASFDVEEIDDITSSDDESSVVPRRAVGLYGDASSLQIDTLKSRSRDPIISFGADELQPTATPLYGVTTVRYFLSEGGLARQEVVRDVELWESTNGGSATLEASTRVVAQEVVDLRFIYSDGAQSLETWDTEEQDGAMPVAVEVWLTFESTDPGQAGSAPQQRTYRIVCAPPSANQDLEEPDVSQADQEALP